MLRKLFIAIVMLSGAQASADETHTRGWIEHARVMPSNLLMIAKLDSGAKTTSIHAEILPFDNNDEVLTPEDLLLLAEEMESAAFEMMGTRMVGGQPPDDPPGAEIETIEDGVMSELMPGKIRFRLTSRGGKTRILKRQVVRWVSIRRRGGGSIVRPVVRLKLCLAGRRIEGEVNLADRSGFNYPLLIGRNMLSDAGMSIDSREIFVAKRACPPEE
ncbi:MAG: RimK/LysX family protein [Henriciella sp.]